MPDPAQQIAKLRDKLNEADRLYRLGQETGMSDIEWDHALKDLEQLETEHPGLITPDSPTQRVGGDPIDGFETRPHSSPMLSIDNTYNQDELNTWYARTCKLAEVAQLQLVMEPKVDGVALALRYEQGQLVQAAILRVARIVIHVTGDDQQWLLRQFTQHASQFGGELPTAVHIPGANGDTYDTTLGSQS